MTSALALLIGVFVLVYPDDGTGRRDEEPTAATSPRIIARPEDGRGPEQPGDPGGWEQLVLFGVVVAGLGTLGLLGWRSSRRARARARPPDAGTAP